jgi:hypothetical protein
MSEPLSGSNIGNRQTEIRLGPKGRRVFTVAGWNNVLRDAGIFAGNWWIANYGQLRFNKGYATANLGYSASSKRKKVDLFKGGSPFVWTGQWLANFNSRARTEAVAKKGGARFWIVCPIGHPVRPDTSASFRRIPTRESAAVAREYRRAVIVGLQEGRALKAAKQQAKASARAAKKQATAARRAEKRAARSTRIRKATRRAAV